MSVSLRVLNLEDNANDAELNQAMLSARWNDCVLMRVFTRSDYHAALDQGRFDIILSDYTMPGFDGLEALSIARSKCPETPFLFVSGTIGEDTAIEALKHGATDFVLKHRLTRLIPAVDRALQEAAEQAEHKLANETVQQSEYIYREMFESLDEAGFLVDQQNGKIIDVNRAGQTALGCERADILGRPENQFLALASQESDTAAESGGALRCLMSPVTGQAFPVELRTTQLTLYGRPLLLRLCRRLGGN